MVVSKMSESNWNAPAPGELELVRRFLNTWKVQDGSGEPVDELPDLLVDPGVWEERFPGWAPGPGETGEVLVRLRDGMRGMLGGSEGWAERLNGWLEDYPLVARVVVEDGGAASVRYEPAAETGFAGKALATVARSVDKGTFERLKSCPDCRWVFYDKSRSKTRIWCGMYAGEGGRACGTIAKVNRYRQKRRGGNPGGQDASARSR
jgi:predicted RNA-binding Zn ribbon-like protein